MALSAMLKNKTPSTPLKCLLSGGLFSAAYNRKMAWCFRGQCCFAFDKHPLTTRPLREKEVLE